jgi:hypothetical protein
MIHRVVIAGLDPAISLRLAKPCQAKGDRRDKPGDDRRMGAA